MKLTTQVKNAIVRELLKPQIADFLLELPIQIHWDATKLNSKIRHILDMNEHTATSATVRSIEKAYNRKIKRLRKVVQKFYDTHC